MRRRTSIAVAVVGTVLLTATASVVAMKRQTDTARAVPAVAEAAAVSFLDGWVDQGRVVRRDQGGDTVSEGQAYGMFAAVIADDERRFDQIWDWTNSELMRPDGLLAWRWQNGEVVDDQPASDADLDAARALVVAGAQFDRPDLRRDGTDLADEIADQLTATTESGRILLPGLWARSGDTHAYNPSYASPVAFKVLGQATGDARWTELEEGSTAVTAKLLLQSAVPPDWAQVQPDGSVTALGGPSGDQPVQYGFDAARLPLRFAESCESEHAKLVAKIWPTLARTDQIAARLDLGGAALSQEQSPLAWLARAAAASTAGESTNAADDLQTAGQVADQFPTYYGQAWLAIGTAMLTSDVLGGCPRVSA